jgi:hypothetical protein
MPALIDRVKNRRYEGRVSGAGIIPSKSEPPFFGWCFSPDFTDESGKAIICRFGGNDIESGIECVDKWDYYGNTDLRVSFIPKKSQAMSHEMRRKMTTRAITNAKGLPKLDENQLPIFETVPVLDERGQPQFEFVETGMTEIWLARKLIFTRQSKSSGGGHRYLRE